MGRNHAYTRFWHAPAIRNARHAFSVDRWHQALTAGQRRLPDFIIAGAQKSGTTSLYGYLTEHPQVCPPAGKEMSFFDNQFERGLSWYRSHFPRVDERGPRADASLPCLTGESTAYYLFHPHAAKRIAQTLPAVKIILLLRNPVDRAFSHYQLNLRRGNEELSFEEAIAAEPERIAGEQGRMQAEDRYYSFEHEKHSYLARGRYAEQIVNWQRWFTPDRLLILEASELFKRTSTVFGKVLDFLGLPAWQPQTFGNRFPGRYQEKISDAMRAKLTDYFAPHNEQLYSLLGQRFDWERCKETRQVA